jgi:hypothetical protein
MTNWWYCPLCKRVTDEFESSNTKNCPKCRIEETKMATLFQNRFFKVDNKNRHHNAEQFYYFCRDLSGVDYLFTDGSLIEASERAKKNPEDIPNQMVILNPEQVLADRDVFLQSSVDLGVELEMWKARFQNLALCFSAVVVGVIAFAVFFANR